MPPSPSRTGACSFASASTSATSSSKARHLRRRGQHRGAPGELADYGGIALSVNAYDQVRDKLPYRFVDRGEQRVKNIARPVRVYAVDMSASGVAPRKKVGRAPPRALDGGRRVAGRGGAARLSEAGRRAPPAQAASIAVLPFANHSADTKREFFSDGPPRT